VVQDVGVTESAAGARPTRTPSAVLLLIWLAWILVPPLLVFGGAMTSAPFFGEQPTDAELAQASRLLVAAAAVALALPLLGLLLTWRTRRGAAACFGAALVLVAVPVALLEARELAHHTSGPAPDRGPPVCQEYSGGDNDCPGG
jgi:hypothetical protein